MLNRIFTYLNEGLKLHETFGVDEVELLELASMAADTYPTGVKEANIIADTIRYTSKFLEAKIEGIKAIITNSGKQVSSYLDDIGYSVPAYITKYGVYTSLCEGYLYYVSISSDELSKAGKDYFKEALPFVGRIEKSSILTFTNNLLTKHCSYDPKQPAYLEESEEYWKHALMALHEEFKDPELSKFKLEAPKVIKPPRTPATIATYPGMETEEAVKCQIREYSPIEIVDRCETVGFGTLLGAYYIVLINSDNKSAKILTQSTENIRNVFEDLVVRGTKGAYIDRDKLQPLLDNCGKVDKPITFSNAGFAVNSIFSQMGTDQTPGNISQMSSIAVAKVTEFLKDHAILDLGESCYARDPRTGQLLKADNPFILFVNNSIEGSFTNFDAAYTAASSVINSKFNGELLTGFTRYMIVGTKSGWFKVIDRNNALIVYCTKDLNDATSAATDFTAGFKQKWISDKLNQLKEVSVAKGMPEYAVQQAIDGLVASYVSTLLPSGRDDKFLAVVNPALAAIKNISDL